MMSSVTDFFHGRLEYMVDHKHPLIILSTRLPWARIEEQLSFNWQRRPKVGSLKKSPCAELFDVAGGKLVGAGVSKTGRPRINCRLLVSLVYLKHAFNLSDQELCERWGENVVWQYFSGNEYYQTQSPCDPTQIGRFRKCIGESGMEVILKGTIDTAVETKAVKKAELERVIVDSTVQEKAIAYPTDSRLLEIARHHIVKHAKACGVLLKQTFKSEGKQLRRQAGGYAHAKQFKRLKKVLARQRTIVGILIRECQRKLPGLVVPDQLSQLLKSTPTASSTPSPQTAPAAVPTQVTQAMQATQTLAKLLNPSVAMDKLATVLSRAQRIQTQEQKDKNKLYALHAPEVECIGKGKARNPYEFGVKVSLAVTHKSGLIVGAKRFARTLCPKEHTLKTPYDGDTLRAQIEQTNGLIKDSGKQIKMAVVDLGYRGEASKAATKEAGIELIHRGKIKSLSKTESKILKRRQAIEPAIGHLKQDHRLNRNHLKGELGDALHVLGCAAGYNIKWLMRAIMRLGLKGLFALLFLRWYVMQFLVPPRNVTRL